MTTTYYVYMVSNRARLLYVGLTTDIQQMLNKHKEMRMESFKGNFSFDKLVYLEETRDVSKALQRERELKNASRREKIRLLSVTNPDWECISEYWFEKTG